MTASLVRNSSQAHGRRRIETYNITFHGVGEPNRALEDGEEDFWITADGFRAALDVFETRDDVFLTFDDGNRSDVTIVLPELQRRGIKAAFFIAAGHLGEPGFLGTDDVHTIAEAGMVVGCHGLDHRPWNALDDGALADELEHSRSIISAASGRPVVQAACPYGIYDRRVLRRLKQLGYQRVYTSDAVKADRSAWLQARASFRRDDDAASVIWRMGRRQSLRRRMRRRRRSFAW